MVEENVQGMSGHGDGNERKDLAEQQRQHHQLVFEACKHLTTLDTAAALILLGILRELGISFAGAAA